MSKASSREWRFSTRVVVPVVTAGIAAILLVVATLLLTTRESDRLASERQSLLIAHVLSEQAAKISHDQESVTVWDDAVRNVSLHFDPTWTNTNLGAWMHDYFGHDELFLLNSADGPTFANVNGSVVDPSVFGSRAASVLPLAHRLRSLLAAARPMDAANDPSRYRAADFTVVEKRPAIVSILPIVSDSGEIEQKRGSEFLHVAIRYLDGSFLNGLQEEYLLDATRFAWSNDSQTTEAAFPLKGNNGDVIGYFIWTKDQPGWRLLVRSAPALALAFFIAATITLLLAQRVRNASRELQASEAQAQHLAFHDPLTGAPNRARFCDRFDHVLADVRTTGAQVALLYLDVDRFKDINDTLGHPAGDDLIRELCRRLVELVGAVDDVARMGGDEFGIIQTGIAGAHDAEILCERIIHAVAQPFNILGSAAFVGVSIGVAIAPDAGVDRAELIRKADIALHSAKIEGRNQYRIFRDEMDHTLQRRREIEGELRAAIRDGDQFEVVYQPVVSAHASSIVGFEALLRWNHPEHGTIPPGVFIPIAEETGLIGKIGEWVLRQACQTAKRWPEKRIAVNVSALQFRLPGFAPRVLQILGETGLAPHRLEIEVTESVLLDAAERSSTTLNALHAAGIGVSLDDFGTGYSSLTYLQKFPVDRIKVDQSFVRNLEGDPAAKAIVQAMVELARALRIKVTAEGVETAGQRDFLRKIGCDEFQGFLFSRPLSANAAENLLASTAAADTAKAVQTAA